MKELKDFVNKLLNTMVKGVGAVSLLLYLPLCVVMCVLTVSLYYCVITIACVFASLTDDGNLSKFTFPRWADRRKWMPQFDF